MQAVLFADYCNCRATVFHNGKWKENPLVFEAAYVEAWLKTNRNSSIVLGLHNVVFGINIRLCVKSKLRKIHWHTRTVRSRTNRRSDKNGWNKIKVMRVPGEATKLILSFEKVILLELQNYIEMIRRKDKKHCHLPRVYYYFPWGPQIHSVIVLQEVYEV